MSLIFVIFAINPNGDDNVVFTKSVTKTQEHSDIVQKKFNTGRKIIGYLRLAKLRMVTFYRPMS